MAVPCPYCQGEAAKPVRFTAWGGVIGPFMLSLVKCRDCGEHFNGKNGRCVKKAIRLYTMTTLVLLAVLTAFVMYQVSGARTGAAKGTARDAGVVPAISENADRVS